jgi:hypothetical protein
MIGEHVLRGGLVALMLLGAGACTPRYDVLELEWISGPAQAEVSSSELSVPEGRLVVFSVDPVSAGLRDYDAIDELELTSESPAVARIEQGLATGTWMLMGVAQGQTMLEVRINGELEDRIAVDVIAQEVAP